MGRACLKEGLKEVKVRFHGKNIPGEGRTGVCGSLQRVRSASGSSERDPFQFFEGRDIGSFYKLVLWGQQI